MTQLILTEKPNAARKLAAALTEAGITTKKKGAIPIYQIQRKGQTILIASAVGHLFSLAPKTKSFPNFDLEWKPTYEISESAGFTKGYAMAIQEAAKFADDFIVATDYDIEGEVIGLNALRFLCNRKDARRMKFSTLTKQDLIQAYDSASKTLDWGQANAGEARHYLDWFYGINLSKAASQAIQTAINRFQTLSIGRVQGPALALLAQKEIEIQNFKPQPYWQIFINILIKSKAFKAAHILGDIFEKAKAELIFKKIKDKPAKVIKAEKTQQPIYPPTPFDLTTLQMEAYRCFKLSPKITLQLAQQLYEASLISYPRTSSQKLPPTIGYKYIFGKLSKILAYTKLVQQVPQMNFPRQGGKEDPAHPAIYPTGEHPKSLTAPQKAVYDLIVKRFCAVFGKPALREITDILFDVETEKFALKGEKILDAGWLVLYQPYIKMEAEGLPVLKTGEIYAQKSAFEEKMTESPRRYSEATVIKKLEQENLGTKSTRAQIIDILFQRGYLDGSPIAVTELGLAVVKTFAKYAPEILSANLTREFEDEMEKLREGKIAKEIVLEKAKKIVTKLCYDFVKSQVLIGKELAGALEQTTKNRNVLCTCFACKKGNMRMIVSKKSGKRFMACSGYPECQTTWPLPQQGLLKFLKVKCPKCKIPLIVIYKKGKKPWQLCTNPACRETKTS